MKVWIGLAHVQPQPGCEILEEAAGAFVPAVGLAESVEDFAAKVAHVLCQYALTVVEIEDIEVFQDRCARFDVAAEVRELVQSLNDENPVVLAAFEAYLADDA